MVTKTILAEKIGKDPRCSGNREGLDCFAPSRMIVGIRKKQRHPHDQPEAHEHHRQQASREKCHSIRKQRNGREGERNRRRKRPKHLTRRKPARNELGGSVDIKRLLERKRSDAGTKQNAADPP